MRYKTGTKKEVLRSMAYYAIRDQSALIEALTPRFTEPDEVTEKYIEEIRERIEDYKRLARGKGHG